MKNRSGRITAPSPRLRRIEHIRGILLALSMTLIALPSAEAQRVTSDLETLYEFAEGTGNIVADTSGSGAPLDLTIDDPASVRWLVGGGLAIDAPTLISSLAPASALSTAIRESGELTLEVWLKTADLGQNGPARIVTLSGGSLERNFTLGQGRWGSQPTTTYDIRLRSSTTSTNGQPSLTSPVGAVLPEIEHVLFTRSPDGTTRLYVGGEEIATSTAGGDLSDWNTSFELALGNELDLGRPWLGELHRVSIYSRALTAAEAAQNFDAGPGTRPERVTDQLQALYTFLEGEGDIVADVSGVGSPLDLTIDDQSAVSWLAGGGISLDTAAAIRSAGAAAKISDAVAAAGEVTVEAWIRPGNLTQDGPARIVSISDGPFLRNLTFGQGGSGQAQKDLYGVRLRTTSTSLNGTPEILTDAGVASTEMQHVVFTRDAGGTTRIYVDDVLQESGFRGGVLSDWDSQMPLVLGNETTSDRPWLGELHLVALYSRALESPEITQNFYSGPATEGEAPVVPAPGPPSLSIGPERAVLLDVGESVQMVAEWSENAPEALRSSPLVWSTSNPAIATISESGLVTAVGDDAYALIMVHATEPMAHIPGTGSVTVGAEVKIQPVQLDPSLVQEVASDPGVPESIRVLVTETAETSAIVVGDYVHFPNIANLRVDAVEDQGSQRLFHSAVPDITEVYEELDIDLTVEEVRPLKELFMAVLRPEESFPSTTLATSSAPLKNDPAGSFSCNIWNFLVPDDDIVPTVRINLKNGTPLTYIIAAKGFASVALKETDIDVTVECFGELVFPLGPPFPVAWVGTIAPGFIFRGGFSVRLDSEAAQTVRSPSASYSQSFDASISGGEEQETAVVFERDEPETSLSLGGIVGEFLESTETEIRTSIFGEVGARFTLRAALTYFGDIDILNIRQDAGIEVGVPAGLHSFEDPEYTGPELTGFMTANLISAKARIGGEGVIWKLFNLNQIQLQTATININNFELPWPVAGAPAFSPGLVYPDSTSSEFPRQTLITVPTGAPDPISGELTMEYWPGYLDYPIRRYELWGRLYGSGDPFEELWESASSSWVIEPELAGGLYEIRALLFYDAPCFSAAGCLWPESVPVASGSSLLTIQSGTGLTVTGVTELDRELGVTQEETQVLTLSNGSDTALDYVIDVQTTEGWFSVDGFSAVADTIEPGEELTHGLTFTCGSEAPATYTSVLRVAAISGAETEYLFPMSLECSAIGTEPEVLKITGVVGEDPVTKRLFFRSLADDGFDAILELAGETGGLLQLSLDGAGEVFVGTSGDNHMEATLSCDVALTEQAELVFRVGEDIVHRVAMELECLDEGGDSFGDPHLETFDGVPYDFQAIGEFVLVKNASGDFEVQVRQQGSGGVSINHAVAMRVGDDRVAFYLDAPEGGGRVMQNGDAIALDDLASRNLPGGGEIHRLGSRYYVLWPDSATYVTVRLATRYINLSVYPDDLEAGQLSGLMGDFDGDGANDFRLRDETPLASPPSFSELYDCSVTRCMAYDPAAGWIIRELAESLFDYSPGEGPETFAPDTDYPADPVNLGDHDASLVAYASALCTQAGILDPILLDACVLDIVVAGDVEMGLDAADVTQGAVEADVEICDGVDNDFDGDIDEDDICQCTPAARDNGQLYDVCDKGVPWIRARGACLARGRDLVVIEDQSENDWLEQTLAAQSSLNRWIGGTDEATEGAWVWVNGTPLPTPDSDLPGYQNWSDREPNDAAGNENCVQFIPLTGLWNDIPCAWEETFVCE